jgi:hypothetical protein
MWNGIRAGLSALSAIAIEMSIVIEVSAIETATYILVVYNTDQAKKAVGS